MRGVKIKRMRQAYIAWLEGVKDIIPKGMKPISFRSWRKRVRGV